MRVRDGDRVINSACTGLRISQMLIVDNTIYRIYRGYSVYAADSRSVCGS